MIGLAFCVGVIAWAWQEEFERAWGGFLKSMPAAAKAAWHEARPAAGGRAQGTRPMPKPARPGATEHRHHLTRWLVIGGRVGGRAIAAGIKAAREEWPIAVAATRSRQQARTAQAQDHNLIIRQLRASQAIRKWMRQQWQKLAQSPMQEQSSSDMDPKTPATKPDPMPLGTPLSSVVDPIGEAMATTISRDVSSLEDLQLFVQQLSERHEELMAGMREWDDLCQQLPEVIAAADASTQKIRQGAEGLADISAASVDAEDYLSLMREGIKEALSVGEVVGAVGAQGRAESFAV